MANEIQRGFAGQAINQGLASALNVQRAPDTRAAQIVGRLEVLLKQLHEVRGMTFAATERILGSEATPVSGASGQMPGPAPIPCFMSHTENTIGELERAVSEIRDELGRINRAF